MTDGLCKISGTGRKLEKNKTRNLTAVQYYFVVCLFQQYARNKIPQNEILLRDVCMPDSLLNCCSYERESSCFPQSMTKSCRVQSSGVQTDTACPRAELAAGLQPLKQVLTSHPGRGDGHSTGLTLTQADLPKSAAHRYPVRNLIITDSQAENQAPKCDPLNIA